VNVDKESFSQETVDELKISVKTTFASVLPATGPNTPKSCRRMDELWATLPKLDNEHGEESEILWHQAEASAVRHLHLRLILFYRSWEFVGRKEHRPDHLDKKENFIENIPIINTETVFSFPGGG